MVPILSALESLLRHVRSLMIFFPKVEALKGVQTLP